MCNNGLNTYYIKTEETAKYYDSVKGQGHMLVLEMEVKHWTHPANTVEITDGQVTTYMYTQTAVKANTE